jgi:hypothetical protein
MMFNERCADLANGPADGSKKPMNNKQISTTLLVLLSCIRSQAAVGGTVSVTRSTRQASAAEIANDASLAGKTVFDFFLTTDGDILSISDVVITLNGTTNGSRLYQNALNGDVEPPSPAFVAVFPALGVDSWISTPGGTSGAGGGFANANSAWFDSDNNGPQNNFHFAGLTTSDNGSFAFLINIPSDDGQSVVNFPFDFAIVTPVALHFNSPIASTLADVNGQGTGFTHRLPGTGSEIAASDPNLDLSTSPGKLRLTSTLSHFNQLQQVPRRNLASLDAPGVLVPSLGLQDISMTAVFEDVALAGPSDELSLYAGLDQNTILRAGFASGNAYQLTINTGGGDETLLSSPLSAFAAGDDVTLTLSRIAGVWSLQWNNLTTSTTGSLSSALPWLASTPDLYVGVHASHAPFATPFVSIIDQFSVLVGPELGPATAVPEPSTWALVAVTLGALRHTRRGRAKRGKRSRPCK